MSCVIPDWPGRPDKWCGTQATCLCTRGRRRSRIGDQMQCFVVLELEQEDGALERAADLQTLIVEYSSFGIVVITAASSPHAVQREFLTTLAAE